MLLLVSAASGGGAATGAQSACAENLATILDRTSREALAPGAQLSTWDRDGARPVGQGRAVHAVVITLRPSGPALRPVALGLPLLSPPAEALATGDVVAMVNGDLFDSFRQDAAVPYSPIVTGGQIRYAPPGMARALNLSLDVPSTSRTRLRARAVFGTAAEPVATVRIAAINHYSLDHGAVLFTPEWTGRTPPGAATITIKRGRVTGIDIPGSPRRPHPREQIIQIPTREEAGAVSLGESVIVSARLTGARAAVEMMGYSARILHDGAVTVACSPFTEPLRPRTALAWNASGTRWLVVVTSGLADPPDGVRVGGSSVPALANWLAHLGATDAVLFDGGGSTIMLTHGLGTGAGTEPIRRDLPEAAWQRPLPAALTVVARR